MFLVIVLSVLLGVVITLLIQYIVFKSWFLTLPILGPTTKPQYQQYVLPQELLDIINDPDISKKKETCLCLNAIFQFLFRELKDTKRLRNWVMKRMQIEFNEMLATTTGKLLDTIVTRDFNLGKTFPVIKQASIQSISAHKDNNLIDEVTLLLDLTYNGGFQLAVDVDMVFGKSAFLSVTVTKLQGTARLQFTRIPYTHWSFSFIEEPVMEFEVESQFEGRPIPQITSLIINQIRRSVRKKHTLPAYKIRYKPFFIKPEPQPPPQDIYYHGSKLSRGHLKVTILQCNRLVKVAPDALLYCTLAVDSLPWVELMSSRRKLWVAQDIDIVKVPGQNVGLTFREDFVLDRYEELVLVESIAQNTPADKSDIRKNDVVVSVGGVKVNSSKQAVKLIKQAGDRFTIRIERSSSLKGLAGHTQQDFRVEEEAVIINKQDDNEEEEEYINIILCDNEDPNETLTDSSQSGGYPQDPNSDASNTTGHITTAEEYINITITPVEGAGEGDVPPAAATTASSGSDHGLAGGASHGHGRKGSGFSILGSSSGLFHRKKGSRTDMNKSPSSSPEMKRKLGQEVKVGGDDPGQGDKVKSSSDGATKQEDKNNGPITNGDMNDVSANQQPPTISAEADTEAEAFDLKKTHFVKSSQDPAFDEAFDFDLEDQQNYLNICVWAKIPEKTDKQNRVTKPEKDILLGHLSLSLMDISLDCLTTLQGDSQQTYHLTPAETKAGATRAKFGALSTHPGFVETLCYGDISLHFQHSTQPLSNSDREAIHRLRAQTEASQLKERQQASAADLSRKSALEEGKHDFVNTHFQTATYCKFCGKKIWLKAAFQCSVCGLVCHRKCTDKCQANTICSKDGYKRKELPNEANPVPSKKPAVKDDQLSNGKDSVDTNTKEPVVKERTSFLNRFRNKEKDLQEDVVLLIKQICSTPSGSPSPSNRRRGTSPSSRPLEIPSILAHRRNSASEAEGSSVESGGEGAATKARGGLLSVVGSVPRTRSSTSLQDLIRQNHSPSLPKPDLTTKSAPSSPETSDSDSEDSDDELRLLRYWEQQKSGTAAHAADEMVVTAAKQMGKELFANMNPQERKDKLDSTISKMQLEIDKESENRAELARLEKEVKDEKQKTQIRAKIDKSDEKIQSLAVLMLHYCSGLQHCLDQQELDKQEDTSSQSGGSLQMSSHDSTNSVAQATANEEPGIDLESSTSIKLPDEDHEKSNDSIRIAVNSGSGDLINSGSYESSKKSESAPVLAVGIDKDEQDSSSDSEEIQAVDKSLDDEFNDCIEKDLSLEEQDKDSSSNDKEEGTKDDKQGEAKKRRQYTTSLPY